MRSGKDGGDKGIWISKNGSAVAMAIALDDGDEKTGTWSDTFKYDPVTGNPR